MSNSEDNGVSGILEFYANRAQVRKLPSAMRRDAWEIIFAHAWVFHLLLK